MIKIKNHEIIYTDKQLILFLIKHNKLHGRKSVLVVLKLIFKNLGIYLSNLDLNNLKNTVGTKIIVCANFTITNNWFKNKFAQTKNLTQWKNSIPVNI